MKEKLVYSFEIKILSIWINPIKVRFPAIRDCWKFAVRNKEKYYKYNKRIAGYNSEMELKFETELTITKLDFYENHIKMIEVES